MIKLESVVIENFRGIKELTLSLRQDNFGICGPNGTGKSGIVDAIEFGLTGNITRLTGRGSKDLSVKEHASHVDLRQDPKKAIVRLSAYSPALEKRFVVERSVDKPQSPRIEPNDSEIQALVERLQQHPELALSRREIVKYVIVEPGERSKEVQALLKLENFGDLRKSLNTARNKFKSTHQAAAENLTAARTSLLSGLGIGEGKSAHILEAVNRRRALLSLEMIVSLERDTKLNSGCELVESPLFSKVAARADMVSLRNLVCFPVSSDYASAFERIREIISRLEAAPALLLDLQQHSWLQKGLELLVSNECPLCGTHWRLEELRQRIEDRLSQARIARELQTAFLAATQVLKDFGIKVSTLIDLGASHSRSVLPGTNIAALQAWRELISQFMELLDINKLHDLRSWLNSHSLELPQEAEKEIALVEKAIDNLPDQTERQAARDFLMLAQERFCKFTLAKSGAVIAKLDFDEAAKVAEIYETVSDEVLSGLYKKVEADFSRYYALLHREDEGSFFAKLTPSLAKLSFAVDFYGRGTFPPGAYHSEGHQDSMGLCLYLALMKRTMGTDFSLAILDDVLMSVDAGHRKEVVRLLKAEFPTTQFIFTTHDQVWLNHMRSEGLITGSSAALQIRRWTVDHGPLVWGTEDVWREIGEDLEVDDVPAAAALLRRYLERSVSTIAERLRASTEYRADGAHDFGELISSVVSRWKELLRMAKAAANSWNKRDEVECLNEMDTRFTVLYSKTGIDNWAMNKAVHYNEWVNLRKGDFAPLVAAYRAFLAYFECPNCKVTLYVTPSKGSPESLRCSCNVYNLMAKKGQRPNPSSPKGAGEVSKQIDQKNLF